jgi:hypothetical protein
MSIPRPELRGVKLQAVFSVEFGPNGVTNAEPLLVNTAGSLQYRPDPVTEIQNLVLASDYVRTFTDLATMEAANEAARHAVNGIIHRSGAQVPLCDVFPLEEPSIFAAAKAVDWIRFRLGLPHIGEQLLAASRIGTARIDRWAASASDLIAGRIGAQSPSDAPARSGMFSIGADEADHRRTG